jgi:hypothetical protein
MSDMKSRLVRIARWRYTAAWMITCVVAGVGALFLGTLAYSIGWAVIELPSVVRAYPAYQRGELGLLDTAFFGLGLPILALAFPVFGYHLGLPRWTAWEDAAHWPGVAAVANAGAMSVVAFGMATWLLLIVAARRAPNLWFLLVIQTLVLLAAPVGMLDW